jgi:PIN domain nuclease of toxin-antitoxin system
VKPVLLDTHAFLWFVHDDPKLSLKAVDVLADMDTDAHISDVVIWEIAIKVSIEKLRLPTQFSSFILEHMRLNRIKRKVIGFPHLLAVSELPLHHRDPFDRMLIAQSLVDDIPILSADPALDRYGVERIW